MPMSLEADVVDGECERAGAAAGAEKDGGDVVAVGLKGGEGNRDFFPFGAHGEALDGRVVATGLGEEHEAVGPAVAANPEAYGLLRRKIGRFERMGTGREHCAGPGV